MKTLKQVLQVQAEKAIVAACDADVSPVMPPEITSSDFGHYQCNTALKLAKLLKQNPRALAQTIIDKFDMNDIEEIEVAGPGFINITLKKAYLSAELNQQLEDPKLGAPTVKRQKIIVEFSSPNIAKELHVGHLRSTIIGDAIARLFEFLGHDVLRLNHVGDWGTQFGMLIAYMKEEVPEVLDGTSITDLDHLMTWYKASKKRFDEDAEFKKRAQLEVVALQGGNADSLKAWEAICSISRKAFREIYHLLDVKLQERGESFYNPLLEQTINDLKDLISISEGAKCIFLEGYKGKDGNPLPMIIQKSDGGYNYSTTDMAAMRHRVEEEKADQIIVVTDNGQKLHFQMIADAGKKAGFLRDDLFHHVTFGVVLSSDGKKFKTREGDTIKLINLLQEAIDRADQIFQERHPDLDAQERQQMATILGIDAVKYADLSCLRTKDYTFSYDRMLSFEGNTAAFLLYAYVRIQGIKRRLGAQAQLEPIVLTHPSEIELGLHLRRFGEILELVTRDLLPNRLCDYLYELAEKFNAFFRDCHVEGNEQQGSRLSLCELTAQVLSSGLNILGLRTLDKM